MKTERTDGSRWMSSRSWVYDAEDPDEELGVLDASVFQQRLGELSKDDGRGVS